MTNENEYQEQVREVEYEQWAEEWEGCMRGGQLTHIETGPLVDKFVKEGKKAIPFVLERMTKKRLWYIPLEKIIEKEFNERIEPTEKFMNSPEVPDKDFIEAKFAFLEGHRLACLNWARKNKYLPEEKE